ncbi:hypothetical protein GGR19_001711 [Croceicoccus naphthovorans]|nr:hypothetical protein [Croceicoccus naphthovorans]
MSDASAMAAFGLAMIVATAWPYLSLCWLNHKPSRRTHHDLSRPPEGRR